MRHDTTSGSQTEAEFDRELEAALSVEPSPEFVSRVRTHVAGMREPVAWSHGWAMFAAGSMVAAVVVTFAVTRPHDVPRPEQTAPVSTTAMLINAPSLEPTSEPTAAQAAEVHEIKDVEPVIREPEMLISPREAAAMRRFLSQPPIEWVEISMITIEPQHLPKLEITPLPMFDFMSAPNGEIQ